MWLVVVRTHGYSMLAFRPRVEELSRSRAKTVWTKGRWGESRYRRKSYAFLPFQHEEDARAHVAEMRRTCGIDAHEAARDHAAKLDEAANEAVKAQIADWRELDVDG